MPIDKAETRIRLPHGVIVRAPGLLPMHYLASELASEIGIPERTLRDWLRAGAPHFRAEGHVWVDGPSFAGWVKAGRRTEKKVWMAPGEGWCFTCNAARRMVNAIRKPVRGKMVHVIGTCPECGSTIQRGDRDGKAD